MKQAIFSSLLRQLLYNCTDKWGNCITYSSGTGTFRWAFGATGFNSPWNSSDNSFAALPFLSWIFWTYFKSCCAEQAFEHKHFAWFSAEIQPRPHQQTLSWTSNSELWTKRFSPSITIFVMFFVVSLSSSVSAVMRTLVKSFMMFCT